MTGPAILVFLGFVIFPVADGGVLRLLPLAGVRPVPTDFVGLRNYVHILQDSAFLAGAAAQRR